MLINTKLHSCINKSLLVLLCILQAKKPKQNESYSQQFVLLCIMKVSSYRPVIPVGQCRYFILKHLLTDANDVQRMVCIPHCSCLHNVNFNVCFGGIFFFFCLYSIAVAYSGCLSAKHVVGHQWTERALEGQPRGHFIMFYLPQEQSRGQFHQQSSSVV